MGFCRVKPETNSEIFYTNSSTNTGRAAALYHTSLDEEVIHAARG